MSIQQEIARKKAELLIHNELYVEPKTTIPTAFERSRAGPSTGKKTLSLRLHSSQVKLEVSTNPHATFSLQQQDETYHLLKNNTMYVENVSLLPVPFHAPHQIFLTISNHCIHRCGFCAISMCYPKHSPVQLTTQKLVKLLDKTKQHAESKAYAFTGGVYPSQHTHISTLTSLLTHVRTINAEAPIGVEPTIQAPHEIQTLFDAGATEIKINIQVATHSLYHALCPDFCYEQQHDFLKHAVDIFGKGKVCSNIIVGLGETPDELNSCIKSLASAGVVPTIRLIRHTPAIKKEVEKRIGHSLLPLSADSLVCMAKDQKTILQQHNLTPLTFSTMCHACECCDLVPYKDL